MNKNGLVPPGLQNKMGEPAGSGGGCASSSSKPEGERPADAGVWGSDAQNADEADERREEGARQDDVCPRWPHINPKQLRTYRKRHGEKKVQEYIFLYSCEKQCIDCCLKCIQEYNIDPKNCVSTEMDGLGWAGWGGKTVSKDFAEFWESLTS